MLLARLALTILDPSVQSLAHLDALAYVSSTRQIGGGPQPYYVVRTSSMAARRRSETTSARVRPSDVAARPRSSPCQHISYENVARSDDLASRARALLLCFLSLVFDRLSSTQQQHLDLARSGPASTPRIYTILPSLHTAPWNFRARGRIGGCRLTLLVTFGHSPALLVARRRRYASCSSCPHAHLHAHRGHICIWRPVGGCHSCHQSIVTGARAPLVFFRPPTRRVARGRGFARPCLDPEANTHLSAGSSRTTQSATLKARACTASQACSAASLTT